MAKSELGITVGLDLAELKKSLDDMRSSFKSSFVEIKSGIDLAEKGFSYLKKAAETVLGLFERYAAKQKIEAAFRRALEAQGVAIEENLKKIVKYDEELGYVLGKKKTELLALQTTLLKLGVPIDQLKEATEATIGLADVTGRDLQSASIAVSKAFAGNLIALKRLVPTIHDVADAHRILAEFARQSKLVAIDSVGTGLDRLANSWNSLKTAIGEFVSKSLNVPVILDKITNAIRALQKLIPEGPKPGEKREITGLPAILGGLPLFPALDLAYRKFQEFQQNAIDFEKYVIHIPRFAAQKIGISLGEEEVKKSLEGGLEEYKRQLREQAKLAEERKRHADEQTELMLEEIERREEAERQAQIRHLEASREYDQMLMQYRRDRAEEHVQIEVDKMNRIAKINEERREKEKEFENQLSSMLMGAYKTLAQGLGEALASGANVGDLMQRILGGVMSQFGSMLVSLGAATIAAAVASGPALMLWGATGGPVAGVAAGASLIAIGTGLMVGGGYIGASAGGSAQGRAGSTPMAGPGYSGYGGGFGGITTAQTAATKIYNISIGRVFGDDARAGREIIRAVRAAETLGGA